MSLSTPLTIINNTPQNLQWAYNLTMNASNKHSYTNNDTQNLIYIHPRLNITRVYNAFTLNNISNFSGNVSSGLWIRSFNVTSGYSLIPLDNGTGNYTVYVEAIEYAISNETNYKNLEIANTTNLTNRELSFGLYSNNSVYVNVFDEDTLNLITSNITLTVTGNSTETTYNFVNGSLFVTNISDGAYNFKFEAGGNYTSRTYAVTVAERSFQYLNAYLPPTVYKTILIVRDFDTSTTIEGVSITMSRLINSSWVVVESKTSDITGRAQFSYIQNIKYRFYLSLAEYTSKTFDLDPILFESYNVRLEKITTINDTIDHQKVYIDFTPKRYYNDAQNNFSIFFASPTGLFESYSYNLTFPGGTIAGSGVNANGENFVGTVNITGAGFFDKINVSYTYDITIGDERTFKYVYYIDGSDQGNNTFIENEDETYGMGIFERVLIATMMAIVIGGSVSLVMGAVPGLVVALLFMGIFTQIGFYPLWLFLISALVGFVLIVKYGS